MIPSLEKIKEHIENTPYTCDICGIEHTLNTEIGEKHFKEEYIIPLLQKSGFLEKLNDIFGDRETL